METNSAVITNPPYPKNYANEFLMIEKGEGVYLYDKAGKKYLDFGSGIAVNALGYGREDLADIASNQMKKLVHISNIFITEPAKEFSEKLVGSGDFAAVHFGNSGAEATEAALKYARMYSYRKKGEGHHKFLTFKNGFHGRTMGALSVTPTPAYQEPFGPLVPGVEAIPFNDVKALEETLDESFAGVILEVVQGEGGLNSMTEEFAAALNKLCTKYDVVIIADEVQTGLGRTGYLYAHEMVGLKPDIVTLSKPLAGGLPLSATLIPAKINDFLKVGEHGTTFGGGPVTTALASYIWDIVTAPEFIAEVKEKGEYLTQELEALSAKYDFLGEVKGKGLLQGIEIKNGTRKYIVKIMAAIREKGLLTLRSGENILRIAPPLIITKEELKEGITILENALHDMKEELAH